MTVNVSHHTVPLADLNWGSQDVGEILPILTIEFETWIAACNLNSGNANKQITLEKKYSDAIDNTYRGFVVRAGHGDGVNSFIWAFLQETDVASGGSVGNYYVVDSANWTDDGSSNGGYGAFSSPVATSGSIGWYNTGSDSDFFIASSLDVSQEFFLLAWNHKAGSSTVYRDAICLYKDENNRWSWVGLEGTDVHGVYQQATYQLIELDVVEDSTDAQTLMRGFFRSNDTNFAGQGSSPGDKVDVSSRPAHPQIWMALTNQVGWGGRLTNGTLNFYGISERYFVIEADQ